MSAESKPNSLSYRDLGEKIGFKLAEKMANFLDLRASIRGKMTGKEQDMDLAGAEFVIQNPRTGERMKYFSIGRATGEGDIDPTQTMVAKIVILDDEKSEQR